MSEKTMELAQHVEIARETIEALYFFTQGLKDESAEHLEKIRTLQQYLLPSSYPKLLIRPSDPGEAVVY